MTPSTRGPDDDPPMRVIVAAFAHLVESGENVRNARDELDFRTIQQFNTGVTELCYRTRIKSTWR